MKKSITSIFILLSLTFYGQWVEQTSGVTQTLNDVHCITENNVIVVGNAGTILKTIDGGTNWLQKASGTTQNLVKVKFIDANIGYAIGENGLIIKTINAGENWTTVSTIALSQLSDLTCINENTFFVASGNIKNTIDGGSTFTILTTPLLGMTNIQFLNSQIGFAAGENGLIKTIDGGNNWTVKSNYYVNAFYFINENVGFINTRNGNFKTSDGGLNFVNIGGSNARTMDLFTLDENIVWEANGHFLLCGCPPTFCISKKDYNQSIDNQETQNCNLGNGLDLWLNAVHFANATKGYVVGSLSYTGIMGPHFTRGAIFKNSTGIMLGVNKIEVQNEIKIYPNPATDQITISFNETNNQDFMLEIVDCLGKKVFSKLYKTENNISINTEKFTKGIYFLTLIGQDKVQTEKIIIN